MEPEITVGFFLQEMARYNYIVFGNSTKPFNLNIVGWRRLNKLANQFDDYIAIYWTERGVWQSRLWPATTSPGTPWLLNPMNPKGAAILVPGQYTNVYRLEIYKGYWALKQAGSMKVYRDNNRDSQLDQVSDTIEEGLFGIHIHRAGIWSKLVGVNSAGCQVFQKRRDFEEFIESCQRSANLWGNSFTYTLMEF